MLQPDSSRSASAIHAAVVPEPRRENLVLVADHPVRTFGVPHGFTYDVAVVGMGYVGLPTALSFTSAGLSVIGVDLNPERLHDIRVGTVDLVRADVARLGSPSPSSPSSCPPRQRRSARRPRSSSVCPPRWIDTSSPISGPARCLRDGGDAAT